MEREVGDVVGHLAVPLVGKRTDDPVCVRQGERFVVYLLGLVVITIFDCVLSFFELTLSVCLSLCLSFFFLRGQIKKALCIWVIRIVFKKLVQNLLGFFVITVLDCFTCFVKFFLSLGFRFCFFRHHLIHEIFCLRVMRIVLEKII